MERNWSYTITEGEHIGKTLWSGRYCTVSAFIFCKFPDGWKVLANKRGKGTPDFQGKWNCPSGYLEAGEDSEMCCSRETYEETGVNIEPCRFYKCYTETNPLICNKENVTIYHYAILYYGKDNISTLYPDRDEVESIAWISINNISNLEWAFFHECLIFDIFNKYISNELWKSMNSIDKEFKISLYEYIDSIRNLIINPEIGVGYFATEDKVSPIDTFEVIDLTTIIRLGITHVCWYKK